MDDPFALSNAPKRSRRGCITCKIRRVKCDETKPHCQRCGQSGRTCDGYAAASTPRSRRDLAVAVRRLAVIGPASRVLGDAVPTEDAACFDFFRLCTAAMTGSVFPAEFWSRQMLQAAHAEPAAWRAAVAIGALHRRWECNAVARRSRGRLRAEASPVLDPGSRDATPPSGDAVNDLARGRFTQQAVEHYCSAISLARSIRDPGALMIVSVALAAAANMAGRWADSHVHTRSGLRLLSQLGRRRDGPMPSDLACVAQSLARLDVMAMTFWDARAPYSYFEEDGSLFSAGSLPDIARFEDSGQASATLFGLIRWFFTAGAGAAAGQLALPELEDAILRVTEAARRWEEEFDALLERTRAKGPSANPDSDSTRQIALSLRLYHTTLTLVLRAGLYGPETRWDPHLDQFDRIISLATELEKNTHSPLPFFMSLEPGLVMPLFLTVTRCRHPVQRRRALGLLNRLNRQEGMWNSSAVTLVAEQIVLLEEETLGLGLPLYVDDLDGLRACEHGEPDGPRPDVEEGADAAWETWPKMPELLRISRLDVIADCESNRVEIMMFRHDDGDGDEFMAKDVILWI